MAWLELCFVDQVTGRKTCNRVWIPDPIEPDWPWDDLLIEKLDPHPVPWIVFGDPRPVPWREILEALGEVQINPKPWKFAETGLVERIDGAQVGPNLRDLGAALHVIRAASTIANQDLRNRLVEVAVSVANEAASLSLPGGEVQLAG